MDQCLIKSLAVCFLSGRQYAAFHTTGPLEEDLIRRCGGLADAGWRGLKPPACCMLHQFKTLFWRTGAPPSLPVACLYLDRSGKVMKQPTDGKNKAFDGWLVGALHQEGLVGCRRRWAAAAHRSAQEGPSLDLGNCRIAQGCPPGQTTSGGGKELPAVTTPR